ncbi:unnamed protein product [Dracunculus medinensis]|uniref:Uncharacterized protein n=1 Tax=Dracunculus medinensis TaxID=318479 RepID=A0A158Q6L3_DRAME|nr:unnamed protein product [Dracunculus medinensis]
MISTEIQKNLTLEEFFGTTQFENSIRVPSLNEIEEIEEIEDRILLGNAADCNNEMNSNPHPIHFRSRLSLIPEQHSVIEEVEEQENCDEDDKDSLKITLNAQKNPHQQE